MKGLKSPLTTVYKSHGEIFEELFELYLPQKNWFGSAIGKSY